MGRDRGSFEIVKAIVGLAHNLRLEVIAEGVETAAQLEHLQVLGCEFAQGFHVSPPLAAEEARALLSRARGSGALATGGGSPRGRPRGHARTRPRGRCGRSGRLDGVGRRRLVPVVDTIAVSVA